MATTNLGDDAADAAVDAVVDLLDAGTTNMYPKIVTKDSGGTVLVENDMTGTTAFGNATVVSTNSQATANTIADGTAVATGDPAECEFQDQDETVVFDCDAGGPVSSAAVKFDGTTITSGQTVGFSSLIYRQPLTSTV